MDEALNYRKRPLMQREYRWYANIADIEFRQKIDITALLIRTSLHLSNYSDPDSQQAVKTLDSLREAI